MRNMNSEDQKKSSRERRRGAVLLEVAGVGIAVFLGVVATAVAVAQANVIEPKLGDIVWFKPGAKIPELLAAAIPAKLVDSEGHPAKSCVLLPAAMSAQGGSLVVEAARPEGGQPTYLVHWAGSRTSTGADDCGARADLLLGRADVENLARVAGGFGLDQKLFPPVFAIHAPPVVMN